MNNNIENNKWIIIIAINVCVISNNIMAIINIS